MFPFKNKKTKEELEILKISWIERFEDLLKEKYQIDRPYNDDEKNRFKRVERKISILISHGYFVEDDDLKTCL